MASHGGPRVYRSLAEFERQELQPYKKLGWSLDDLYADAAFNPGEDDSLRDDEPAELDFDFG
ncbi:MAG: hypothetical protein KC543_13550 [Myxococcales bacterium]|nr:hypothetical protein [Myxococcales bacterium]